MKKKDHLLLASFILDLFDSSVLTLHSAAFTAGCIEPDLNVLTYLRGSRKEKKFHGHNAGNCRTHLGEAGRKRSSTDITPETAGHIWKSCLER